MKLTLTYINRTQRTSKENKPFISLSIKAREYGEKYLSGFGNKSNENWKVGDEVEVAEVKEVQKGDKTYLNFEMPKNQPNGVNAAQISEILTKLGKIDYKLDRIMEHLMPINKDVKVGGDHPGVDYPVDDVKPEDIPF